MKMLITKFCKNFKPTNIILPLVKKNEKIIIKKSANPNTNILSVLKSLYMEVSGKFVRKNCKLKRNI